MTHRAPARAVLSALSLLAGAAAAFADCPADCNGDGKLNINDFICFQSKWKAHDPYGDYDDSGTYTINDFIRFQADFAATLAAGGCSSGTPPVELELAGNSLAQYPHFEFIASFNAGSTVRLAVDPTIHASIAGKSGKAYIVAAKSSAQWDADQSLSDVRGAAQSVSFPGADIQANTIALTSSASLAAGTGTDIAKGYDLVIDLNSSGTLDDGDYIDGRGDEPAFWVVRDMTAAGSLAVTQVSGYTVTWPSLKLSMDEERVYYPTSIASLGELPLVVISHGNGHQYIWYDYLGELLASYGYVVMAHQNDTGPGIDTCSDTTLYHTDAFLGSLATIAGGALNGHVDDSRIIWIGHSRGAEGVVMAYDKILDGDYSPVNYGASDLILIDSISPVSFDEAGPTSPRGVNYHLIYGSSDGDVRGSVASGSKPFCLPERGTGLRSVSYLQGADHNDFNCCGFDDFAGPAGTALGRAEVQQVAKAHFLSIIKHYAEGDQSAVEFLWRQFESLTPLGCLAADTVDREYRIPAGASGKFVIDDYQTETGTATSSSGGAVTFTVANVAEDIQRDKDSTFTYSAADSMNGMTRAKPGDTARCAVFDWTTGADRYYELAVVPGAKDLSAYTYLSLRACQVSRHPETTAQLGDLTFTVTLRDASGTTASVNIGAYGGGIEEPYQRTGDGTGAGWANEFETIRIRTTDFLTNGTGLDLKNIVAVRLNFGATYGASRGRIGLDDVELIK